MTENVKLTQMLELLGKCVRRIEEFCAADDPVRVLVVLETCQKGPVTQRDLAERMGLSQSAISKLLTALSDEGILRRDPKRKDRVVQHRLGNKGRKLVVAMEQDLTSAIMAIAAQDDSSKDGVQAARSSSGAASTESDSVEAPEEDVGNDLIRPYEEIYPDRLKAYNARAERARKSYRRR